MLKALLCWLLGHRFVVKAYTGETMQVTNGLGTPLTDSMFNYERRNFCCRCGTAAPWCGTADRRNA